MHQQSKKTVYIENKTGEVFKSWYPKKLFTLNMFPENKQNKLRQTKNDEIKGYLNYATIIKCLNY